MQNHIHGFQQRVLHLHSITKHLVILQMHISKIKMLLEPNKRKINVRILYGVEKMLNIDRN